MAASQIAVKPVSSAASQIEVKPVNWLEERGINGKCLNAIKAMYDKVTQKVKVGSILGEGFDTYYGVKQGDPLSTDLFGIMIEIFEIVYEYLNCMS